jgi:hypothetical protein
MMGSDGMRRVANSLNFQLHRLSAGPLLQLTNRLLYQLSYLGPVVFKGLIPRLQETLRQVCVVLARVSPMCY